MNIEAFWLSKHKRDWRFYHQLNYLLLDLRPIHLIKDSYSGKLTKHPNQNIQFCHSIGLIPMHLSNVYDICFYEEIQSLSRPSIEVGIHIINWYSHTLKFLWQFERLN